MLQKRAVDTAHRKEVFKVNFLNYEKTTFVKRNDFN